jgi:hypothetical protein
MRTGFQRRRIVPHEGKLEGVSDFFAVLLQLQSYHKGLDRSWIMPEPQKRFSLPKMGFNELRGDLKT